MSMTLGCIIGEKELITKYGNPASSVDFLIELDNGIITIQTKWKGSKRRENKDIHKFLKSTEYLTQIYKERYEKDLVFGLWISRLEPFEDNKSVLVDKKIHSISCFESIDFLVMKTQEWLKKYYDVRI
jgi:hypothetical protein